MERSLAKSILGDMSKTLMPKFVRVFLYKRVDQSSSWSHRLEWKPMKIVIWRWGTSPDHQILVCVPDTGLLIADYTLIALASKRQYRQKSVRILGFLWRALSFNRIITLNTPPKGLKTDSNLKGLGFLIGQHSHQILALLSTSGNISRKDPMAMKDQQKEFGSSGRESRQSRGR